MDRLSTVTGRALTAMVLAGVLLAGACSDDDGAEATPDEDPAPVTVTTQEPATGGLEIPDIPGTAAAPVPSIGFGVAFPEQWQATVLTDEAIHRLEEGTLAQPGFLESAKAAASTGAVFYAAGIDEDGRVGELKIDVQDGADTGPAAVRAIAEQVAGADGLNEPSVVEADGGRVRVDYRIDGAGTDGDGAPIDTYGSQLFVPDGDRLWSLIVTSEDAATQDALLAIFDSSFTLA